MPVTVTPKKHNIFLSSNLKLLRRMTRRSQEEVSAQMGMKRTTYSQYELGNTEPNMNSLVCMSQFYKIRIDILLQKDLRTNTDFIIKSMQATYNPNPNAA